MSSPLPAKFAPTDETRLRVAKLRDRADRAFEHLTDYIWKTPRLIEAEEALEREKIESYFPLTERDEKANALNNRLRSLRAAQEIPKLRVSFPSFVASANLMLSASTFEHWCLALCKEIEAQGDAALTDVPGVGVHRLLKFLRRFDVDLDGSKFCKQAIAAIKIRNCLVHANGVVSHMGRDRADLYRIVASHEYVSRRRFDGSERSWPPEEGHVRIVETGLGDQLVIDNEYSWVSSCYFHFGFGDLLDQTRGEPA